MLRTDKTNLGPQIRPPTLNIARDKCKCFKKYKSIKLWAAILKLFAEIFNYFERHKNTTHTYTYHISIHPWFPFLQPSLRVKQTFIVGIKFLNSRKEESKPAQSLPVQKQRCHHPSLTGGKDKNWGSRQLTQTQSKSFMSSVVLLRVSELQIQEQCCLFKLHSHFTIILSWIGC